MFCYNRTEGGDFMPVGVLTNVCAVFIGTFIGGFIKKILPKHLIEELPKVFGICSVTIGITFKCKNITYGYYGYYFRFCYWRTLSSL